jgi:hypothetical protein
VLARTYPVSASVIRRSSFKITALAVATPSAHADDLAGLTRCQRGGSFGHHAPTTLAGSDMETNADLYREDYFAWIEAQRALLRQGRVQEIDADLLAEELEAMGRRERNELVSRLIILIAHLLKWQYQPAHRTASWDGSIVEQRVQISREMRLSPSLKAFLSQAIQDAYPDAVHIATQQTGIAATSFPALCPYGEREILDEAYWPNAAQG